MITSTGTPSRAACPTRLGQISSSIRTITEGRRRRNTRRTAGYLLYVPSIEPGGPALLTSFGLNGTANLLWNHFLSTSFRELLDTCLDSTRPRVVVALFQSTFHEGQRPQFVGSGVSPEVEVLIDVTL